MSTLDEVALPEIPDHIYRRRLVAVTLVLSALIAAAVAFTIYAPAATAAALPGVGC